MGVTAVFPVRQNARLEILVTVDTGPPFVRQTTTDLHGLDQGKIAQSHLLSCCGPNQNEQCQRWGPIFIPAYLLASLAAWLSGGHYYLDNAFERQARAIEESEGAAC